MKKHWFWQMFLACMGCCIFVPALQLLLWSVTERWPWPGLLPESLSLRTVKELFFGSAKLPQLLLSSISLGLTVAFLGTIIGICTASCIGSGARGWYPSVPFCRCWCRARFSPWVFRSL